MEHRILHHNCLICKSIKIAEVFPIKDHSITQNDFEIFACEDCGFRFTQGIPVAEDLWPYYKSEDYISHSDSSKGLINRLYHIGRDFMLRRKKRLVNRLANQKRVLDIGSGTGYFLHKLQKAGYTVMGVEADEGARKYASDKFGLKILEPNQFLGKPTAEKFGLISMWHVLEHVYDPDEYLKAIHEWLDDQGTAMIAVPNFTSLDAEHYGTYWAGYDVPRHFWHFAPNHVKSIANRNGFEVVEMHRLPLDPFYVSLLSEKYLKSGTSGLFKAFWIGLRGHLKSLRAVKTSSSLVYVLKKS